MMVMRHSLKVGSIITITPTQEDYEDNDYYTKEYDKYKPNKGYQDSVKEYKPRKDGSKEYNYYDYNVKKNYAEKANDQQNKRDNNNYGYDNEDQNSYTYRDDDLYTGYSKEDYTSKEPYSMDKKPDRIKQKKNIINLKNMRKKRNILNHMMMVILISINRINIPLRNMKMKLKIMIQTIDTKYAHVRPPPQLTQVITRQTETAFLGHSCQVSHSSNKQVNT
ncbi:unnamed protein product [Heterobilharzia americana]|nr:unnamed protein product [Heterobilharzia americana]